jgi:hypothetical protein
MTQPVTNQYELCLIMAEFIRQNPKSELAKKLKACKTQAEQIIVFNASKR